MVKEVKGRGTPSKSGAVGAFTTPQTRSALPKGAGITEDEGALALYFDGGRCGGEGDDRRGEGRGGIRLQRATVTKGLREIGKAVLVVTP